VAEKSKEDAGNNPVNLRTPPPLPKSLTDPVPVVIVGTVLFVIATVVLLIVHAPALWIWSCVCGVLLGFVGFGLFSWQRAAARRGSRGAQEGVL
jgi:Protein of unknown function (DUF2530)